MLFTTVMYLFIIECQLISKRLDNDFHMLNDLLGCLKLSLSIISLGYVARDRVMNEYDQNSSAVLHVLHG